MILLLCLPKLRDSFHERDFLRMRSYTFHMKDPKIYHMFIQVLNYSSYRLSNLLLINRMYLKYFEAIK